jgi:hypothetical protein
VTTYDQVYQAALAGRIESCPRCGKPGRAKLFSGGSVAVLHELGNGCFFEPPRDKKELLPHLDKRKIEPRMKIGRRENSMAILNRFPLFGLWNRVAAELIGYDENEAKAIGHGVAVLFAIRARGGGRNKKPGGNGAGGEKPIVEKPESIRFGGDDLPVVYQGANEETFVCRVGGENPQTAETYRTAIEAKVPAEYREKLTEAFRKALGVYPKFSLDGRIIYKLYDGWKRECAAGRGVDLDKLIAWCERYAARKAAA